MAYPGDYREYSEVMIVNLAQLGNMVRLNETLLKGAERKSTFKELTEMLSALGLYSLFQFLMSKTQFGPYSKWAGVAYGTYKLINDKIIEPFSFSAMLEGCLVRMHDNHSFLSANSQTFKAIEIEVAFLEYKFGTSSGTDTIRYVQQVSAPYRYQYHNGAWLYPNG